MKIKPLHDNVILKIESKKVLGKSGIILPDTASKEKPEQGEVIAVGAGKLLESGARSAMSVKVGDAVIFKKYSADEIKISGEEDDEYLVVSESDILAIL